MAVIPQLNMANPIVFQDGTIQYHFRNYLLKLNGYLPPAVNSIADVAYTLKADDANQVSRFTGANPAVTMPVDTFSASDELIIRQAGTGTLVLTTTGITVNGTIPAWSQNVETRFRFVSANEMDVVG